MEKKKKLQLQIKKNKKVRIRTVIGWHSCQETLQVCPEKILSLYLRPYWSTKKKLKLLGNLAKTKQVKIQSISLKKLDQMGEGHQSVALEVKGRPRWKGHQMETKKKQVLLFLDRINDPRNLGSVLRCAWLTGTQAILLPSKGSVGLTSSVMKAAAGGAEHVPVEFCHSPFHQIKSLKEAGFFVCGLDRNGSKSLWVQSFLGSVLFIIGSEDQGIRSTLKNLCDDILFIPQKSPTGHFNLSHAVALALTEFLRQSKFQNYTGLI